MKRDAVDLVKPDWSREAIQGWAPGRCLLKAIRDYQRFSRFDPRKKLAVLRHRFWSAVSGADIQLNSNIGGGLAIPHPFGIVIHPKAKIGVNCHLQQGVTIGHRGSGVPTIGNDVYIGAGACILGPITVGDGAMIGANAVVLDDVPSEAVAVGVPAVIKPRKRQYEAATNESGRPIHPGQA